ncbi:hypothetical protein [Microbulbifer yueqingensis]|uniref:Uncharacterized protein n=1 Tax=Microbulbifer yueqingensis TaxID=658219 RepID=A0A1G9AD49_9GAMM|nr:hypothetical protein [Microbulbifer yueqingensis]SDK25279.1 hypothetical protein SAMN05216212_1958 [Microbulbifer yueqingensis]
MQLGKSIGWVFLVGSTLVSQQLTAAECEKMQPVIFFVNGMNTDPTSANLGYQKIRALFPQYDVRLSYVSTENLFLDVVEAGRQKGIENWSTFWKYGLSELGAIDSEFSNKIVDSWTESYEKAYSRHYLNQPDLGNHLNQYLPVLDAGKNIVLLGYSQGSLYSKMASNWISINEPTKDQQVGAVLVGAVTNSVPFESVSRGSYTTLNSDTVVNGLRLLHTDILPGNYQYVSKPTPNNHSFPAYFEENPNLINRIQAQVDAVAANFESAACTEVIACGSPLVKSGGQGSYSFIQDLGNQPGEVKFEFEAYTIPDELGIYTLNGSEIYSTEQEVSGFHSSSFFVTESEVDTNQVRVDVGAPNEGTEWAFVMGCPGEPVNNDVRDLDRVSISFVARDSRVSVAERYCAMDLLVDGKLAYSSDYQGDSHSGSITFTQTLGQSHSVDINLRNCTEYQGCGGAWGPQCEGWELIFSGGSPRETKGIYSSKTISFDVN